MEPVLRPGEFVFTTISPEVFRTLQIEPWGWFRESEGITLIVDKNAALSANLDYVFPSRMITLNIYSSLEAIGFLAVITKRLAEAGISVNAISAYYHDHLFVPTDKATQALAVLHKIMKEIDNPEPNGFSLEEQND